MAIINKDGYVIVDYDHPHRARKRPKDVNGITLWGVRYGTIDLRIYPSKKDVFYRIKVEEVIE